MKPIVIGSEREVFWDDYIVDTEKTTATKRIHSPVRRELVMAFDKPWEGSACYFINMIHDEGKIKMYYRAGNDGIPHPNDIRICYAESTDGIHWEKPSLGIYEFEGSKENNIILCVDKVENATNPGGDNMFVFKDTNPDGPKDELYKGIAGFWYSGSNFLKCFVSPDGIHFKYGWELYAHKSFFDSVNTAFYDPDKKKYFCYFRGWHHLPTQTCLANKPEYRSKDATRDIRVMESEDFKNWSEPEIINFGENARDFHLYTNGVEPYYRAPHILVGFPFRYTDRYAWTKNYDRLCGFEERKERLNTIDPRFAYTVTDCLFMCSRDRNNWYRPDEAFLRPGPENEWSWRYGDCFMNVGMFETPTGFPGEDNELSFLSPTKRWSKEPSGNLLHRYSMRVDGFISRHADFDTVIVETKPLVFVGNKLKINFESSAAGSVYVEIADKNGKTFNEFRSCELFGNSIDREVDFDGDLATMSGKPIKLRFIMSDADIYSFKFE